MRGELFGMAFLPAGTQAGLGRSLDFYLGGVPRKMRALNMKLLWTWGSLAILTTQAFAQGVLPTAPADASVILVEPAPVPFAPDTATESELDSVIQLSDTGRSALAHGIISEAVSCFKKALASPNLDTATKDSLNLDLATAYLAERELDQAAAALQAVAATDTPAYLLRAALLQSQSSKAAWDGPDGVAAQLARIDPGKLSAADLPWYFTVQARLAEHQDNAAAAQAAWQQAIDHAPPLLQNQFQAALWDSQIILSKNPTPQQAEKLRTDMAAATVPALGAQFAFPYAIMLDQLGQHDEALGVVKHWVELPDLDHKNRDTLRLLWVYLGGKGPAPADPTLAPDPQTLEEDILREPIDINSPDRDSIRQMQKQALSLLEQQALGEKSEGGPVIADPLGLEKFIDGIIAEQDPDSHPLLEQLYFLKAHLALLLNQSDEAKSAASQLLEKYPSGTDQDPYITDAQMVLAKVYWHDGQPDGQPRLAISYLLKVRDSLPADQQAPIVRSLAYLYFMNGDYRSAAESYTYLLNHADPTDPNPPISNGDLLRRAVESELRAGSIDDAVKIMDSPLPTDISSDDLWRAQYNLLIAMRDNNRADDAFQRLNHKLDPQHGKNLLRPELYLRLLWLNAYLAVGRSEPGTADIVQMFKKEIESFTPEIIAGLPPEERKTLADLLPRLLAEAFLLQGESEGQAAQYDQQHKTFEALRLTYPGSDPALNSYFVEAGELEKQNKFTEAQRLYNTVTDNFPKADLAPRALYLSAHDSEKLDKTGEYTEALNLLNKFVHDYSDSEAGQPLIYIVQLEQADLERIVNENPKDKSLENAADLYAILIKKYPNDPLTVRAKVSRADCLFQLATLPEADPQRRQDAIEELQVLYNQKNLPVEARVEVGYKLGKLQEYGSKPDLDAAAHLYFQIASEILPNDQSRTALDNSPHGRFWMLNCLASLKHIYETQNKDADAAGVANMIVEYGLGPATSPSSPAPAPAAAAATASVAP